MNASVYATVSYLCRYAARDAVRIVRWWRAAPHYGQRTYIDPNNCDLVYDGWLRRHSGQVRGGNWDLNAEPFEETVKMRACREHFEKNVPWEDTGIYEYIMRCIAERGGRYDGCTTYNDVVRRYERLDAIYEQVRAEQQLRCSSELSRSFGESHGILVHFDRCGKPIFGNRGIHRFAIARVLQLSSIPVVVGVVHPKALAAGWRVSSR